MPRGWPLRPLSGRVVSSGSWVMVGRVWRLGLPDDGAGKWQDGHQGALASAGVPAASPTAAPKRSPWAAQAASRPTDKNSKHSGRVTMFSDGDEGRGGMCPDVGKRSQALITWRHCPGSRGDRTPGCCFLPAEWETWGDRHEEAVGCTGLTGIPRALRMFILHMGQVRWSRSQGSTQHLWKRCLQWEPYILAWR